MNYNLLLTIVIMLLVGACSNGPRPQADTGSAAYEMLGRTSVENTGGYRLAPGDELSINVYYEPEMSFEKVVIDSGGRIPFPYLGYVKAEDLTAEELAQVITKGLAGRYVIDPQVAISVLEAASQKIIIEGEVDKPGSYPIKGKSTLLEALALAGGPDRTARLDEVIVFRRRTDGVYAARFDVKNIRANLQPDPVLEGGDTVVVGINQAGRFYRDILQVAPLLTIFFLRL
ncbi:polysaccharide biosynthesis/export family protein [Sphingomonas sp. 35-24ZXX]|uniref:polysaccharide biosynthesis/export family protein n=1 Tax=Sphingomonas sp. 35-24ZXX TaxID=1545915 RepID=UPI00053C066D|nr:polysaccharide biosynthesis/export family protein [Sphingomonas sp. 35-24ZXX]